MVDRIHVPWVGSCRGRKRSGGVPRESGEVDGRPEVVKAARRVAAVAVGSKGEATAEPEPATELCARRAVARLKRTVGNRVVPVGNTDRGSAAAEVPAVRAQIRG